MIYLITLLETIPKQVQHVSFVSLFALASILLVLTHMLRPRHIILYQSALALAAVAVVVFTVIGTMMADIQRKDSVIEDVKTELLRLYVKYRPEAEPESHKRHAKWDILTEELNKYTQLHTDDVEPHYRKLFRFETSEVIALFKGYMNYINRKILKEYGTVRVEEIDLIHPWDKILIGIRNMYLEDLGLSFGEHLDQINYHIFK